MFERLIEWDHPDTPTRNPIMWTDLPKMDEPLPKFLDDEDAAKFMAAATRLASIAGSSPRYSPGPACA